MTREELIGKRSYLDVMKKNIAIFRNQCPIIYV